MRIGRRTKVVAAGVGLSGLLAGVALAAPVLVDFSNAGDVEILVDPEAGDSYLYEEVRTGVDALVTIVSATDVTAFDKDLSTLLDNLVVDRFQTSDIFKDQGDINTLLPDTGGNTGTPKSVTYRIDFRDASNDEPVTVSDIAITTRDLDGVPGPQGEYVEFAGITRYCLSENTGIVVTPDPGDGSYRFASKATHGLADEPGWVEVFYGPVSSIVVTTGQSLGYLSQIAQSFDAAGWGVAPVCTDVAQPAPPVPAGPTVSCTPDTMRAGTRVTCTVTGGDPGIDILWRASYDPTFAEAAVTLDEDGRGSFSFVVPAAAVGSEVRVELVDWTAPLSLGTIDGPPLVPTGVPAGEGPGDPRTAWWLGAVLALGLARWRARGAMQRG